MGMVKWLMSLGFIILFAIAVVSYTTNFASDNSAEISLSDDPDLVDLSSDLRGYVNQSHSEINGSIFSFGEVSIEENSETTQTGSTFKGTTVGLLDAVESIFSISFNKIFGNNSGFGYVFTLFLVLIGAITSLYIWKVWKGGNPD